MILLSLPVSSHSLLSSERPIGEPVNCQNILARNLTMQFCSPRWRKRGLRLRGNTHVDVFGQELVGNTIFVNDIVVHSCTSCSCTKEEAEKPNPMNFVLALVRLLDYGDTIECCLSPSSESAHRLLNWRYNRRNGISLQNLTCLKSAFGNPRRPQVPCSNS